MAKQRNQGSWAAASEQLLSRTVTTVTIVYRARPPAHAGETSGAMETVATVCDSSPPSGCHTVAHVGPCRVLSATGDDCPTGRPIAARGQRRMVPSRRWFAGEASGNSRHCGHSLFCLSGF